MASVTRAQDHVETDRCGLDGPQAQFVQERHGALPLATLGTSAHSCIETDHIRLHASLRHPMQQRHSCPPLLSAVAGGDGRTVAHHTWARPVHLHLSQHAQRQSPPATSGTCGNHAIEARSIRRHTAQVARSQNRQRLDMEGIFQNLWTSCVWLLRSIYGVVVVVGQPSLSFRLLALGKFYSLSSCCLNARLVSAPRNVCVQCAHEDSQHGMVGISVP